MAPIDCTGVPCSAGLKWFCKHCCTVHRDKVWSLQSIIRNPTIWWPGCSWSADTITTITTQSSPSPTPANLMASHWYWSPLMVAFSARSVEWSIYNKLSPPQSTEKLYSFKQLLLFPFYLPIAGSHQQIYQIWALARQNCQRKLPWLWWRQKESLHKLHATGNKVRGKICVLVMLMDFIFRKIFLTNDKAESNWMREVRSWRGGFV